MPQFRLSFLLFTLFFLISCSTEYHPVGEYGGIPHGGYTDTRINTNTVIISFSGNPFTKEQTVRDFLLYRAAKVTTESGYDYFIIKSTTPVNAKEQHAAVMVIKMYQGKIPRNKPNAYNPLDVITHQGPATL